MGDGEREWSPRVVMVIVWLVLAAMAVGLLIPAVTNAAKTYRQWRIIHGGVTGVFVARDVQPSYVRGEDKFAAPPMTMMVGDFTPSGGGATRRNVRMKMKDEPENHHAGQRIAAVAAPSGGERVWQRGDYSNLGPTLAPAIVCSALGLPALGVLIYTLVAAVRAPEELRRTRG